MIDRCRELNENVVKTDVIYKAALEEKHVESLGNTGCEIMGEEEVSKYYRSKMVLRTL